MAFQFTVLIAAALLVGGVAQANQNHGKSSSSTSGTTMSAPTSATNPAANPASPNAPSTGVGNTESTGGTTDSTTTGASSDTTAHTSGTTGAMNSTTTTGSKKMSALKSGRDYAVIEFKTGSDQLTDASKEHLRSLVHAQSAASTSSRIEQIHVAAWSDKRFPAAKEAKDLAQADRDLADRRLAAIDTFIKEQASSSDVDTYNMAEKSNWFARAFNTNDAELKSLFSQSGAPANVDPQEFRIVKQRGGPGKAVVLVEMQDGTVSGTTGTAGSSSGTSGAVNSNTNTSNTNTSNTSTSNTNTTSGTTTVPSTGTSNGVNNGTTGGTNSGTTGTNSGTTTSPMDDSTTPPSGGAALPADDSNGTGSNSTGSGTGSGSSGSGY